MQCRVVRKLTAIFCLLICCSTISNTVAFSNVPGKLPSPDEHKYIPEYTHIPRFNFQGADVREYSTDSYSPSVSYRHRVHRGRGIQFKPVEKIEEFESRKPIHINFNGAGRSEKGGRTSEKNTSESQTAFADQGGISARVPLGPASSMSSSQELMASRSYPIWSDQTVNDVDLSALVLSFSDAMVSADAISKPIVPEFVSMQPSLAGHWVWMNQHTLLFQADEKFLPGTTYDITVKSGTKSLAGKVLSKAFETSVAMALPMPELSTLTKPNSILLTFKVPVRTETILPHLSMSVRLPEMPTSPAVVSIPASREVKFRLASDDEGRRMLGENFKPSQTIILIPDAPIETGASVDISILKGIRALRGRSEFQSTSSTAVRFQQNSFNVVKSERPELEPNQSFDLNFDRPIGAKNDPALISVQPPIRDLKISYTNSMLIFQGQTNPGTTYKFTVKKGFLSADGASLEHDSTVDVRVGDYLPRLIPPAHQFQILRKNEKAVLPIKSVNVKKIRVRVYNPSKVSDWKQLYVSQEPPHQERPLLDVTVSPHASENKIAETEVNLLQFLRSGPRQLTIFVSQDPGEITDPGKKQFFLRPTGLFAGAKPGAYPAIKNYCVALQLSNLAATCLPVGNQLVFFVADAFTGKSVERATIARQFPEHMDGGGEFWKKYKELENKVWVTDKHGLCVIPCAAAPPGGAMFAIRSAADFACIFADSSIQEQLEVKIGSLESNERWQSLEQIQSSKLGQPPQQGQSPQFKFSLPFEKSSGVFVYKAGAAATVFPVSFSSKNVSISAPTLSSHCPVILGELKVYETKSGGSIASKTARAAFVNFKYSIESDQPANVQPYPWFRRSALPVKVELISPPTLEVSPTEQERNPHWLQSPTSADFFPSPNNCPLVDLQWQTSNRYSNMSYSHEVTSSPQDLFPLPLIEESTGSPQNQLPVSTQPNTGTTSVTPLAITTASNDSFVVSAAFPKFIYYGDQVDLPISVTNGRDSNVDLTFSFSKGAKEIGRKSVEVQPGKTDIFIDNFQRLVDKDSSGETLSLRVEAQGQTPFISGSPWEFECPTKLIACEKSITSSSVGSLFDVEVNRIVNTPIRTILQRATRVLALCERRRYLSKVDRGDAKLFDKTIETDVASLSEAFQHDFQWMSWYPHGVNDGNNSERLSVTPFLVFDALLTAKECGFQSVDNLESVVSNELVEISRVGNQLIPETTRLQMYAIYLMARSSKTGDPAIRGYLQNYGLESFDKVCTSNAIEQLSGENLAFLTVASQLLPVDESKRKALEARLQTVLTRISDNLGDGTVNGIARKSNEYSKKIDFFCHGTRSSLYDSNGVPIEMISIFDGLTGASWLLSAGLNQKGNDKPSPSKAYERVVAFLEGTAYGGVWNDTTAGICLQALYRYRMIWGGSPANGTFVTQKPSSEDGKMYAMSREFVETKAQDATGDQRDADHKSVWRTGDGIWHCKAGALVTMRLNFLPKERRVFLCTEIPKCVGLVPVEQPPDITYMHAPLFETNPSIREIYNRWPQNIVSNDDGLELYSRAVSPQLYRFDYMFRAPMIGKYYVPAVTVNELFSGAKPEKIAATTLIVEP